MHSLIVSFAVFVSVSLGGVMGFALRRLLPEEHFGSDAKDTVRLATGLIVTMTGLVLGLLVSSAKAYYDSQKNEVAVMSSEIILMNELLVSFGPQADGVRVMARRSVEEATNRIWPKEKKQMYALRPKESMQGAFVELGELIPKDQTQATIKAQISSLSTQLKREYWLMYLEAEQTSISMPLLVVVTSWLTAIFVSFGIFAPPNWTVVVTLVICALAVSAAVFIIMEMYSPFSGILQISPAAVQDALGQMAVGR